MAVAVDIVCPQDEWKLVASGVTDGMIWIAQHRPEYRHKYVAAGATAPVNANLDGSMTLPLAGLPISVDVPSDIYIRAGGAPGKVTVAL